MKTNKKLAVRPYKLRRAPGETPAAFEQRKLEWEKPISVADLKKAGADGLAQLRAELKEPRTFNVAAITTDARTISSQIVTADPAEAVAVLEKWITPEDEKWHGLTALGSVHDMQTKTTTYYRVNRAGVQALGLEVIK